MTESQLDIFSYHNTNNLAGAELHKADQCAKGQESDILAFFRARPGMYLTPEDASAALSARTPLTSVRRAISNLTEKGYLRKTTAMRKGKYGKAIHHWIAQ
jgi:hypothetical protein